MKYIIQVKAKNETRYLQIRKEEQPLWLFEEYKKNATIFGTIKDATKTICEFIANWSWATYTILEEETYYPVKEISISDYK
jgi:hypothetical protein